MFFKFPSENTGSKVCVHSSGTFPLQATIVHLPLQTILPNITNKMQRYTIFLITVNALHVSDGFFAHHQELKSVHTASGICQACLLLPLAWVSSNSPTLVVAASKLDIRVDQMLCVQI
jgi:hypothetical protein